MIRYPASQLLNSSKSDRWIYLIFSNSTENTLDIIYSEFQYNRTKFKHVYITSFIEIEGNDKQIILSPLTMKRQNHFDFIETRFKSCPIYCY